MARYLAILVQALVCGVCLGLYLNSPFIPGAVVSAIFALEIIFSKE